MGSWRDSASPQAQDDLDNLLNEALPFAQQMLDEHGEFFPYAVTTDAAGGIGMVAGDPGVGENPSSLDVLAVLVDGLRNARQSLRAVGLVSDVRLSSSDAIRVELEHVEGPAMAVVLPYATRRYRRGIDYGDLSAAASSPSVWV